MPCVQSFGRQHHAAAASVQPPRKRRLSLQAVATRFSKLQTRALLRALQNRSNPVISNFASPLSKFDAKMATPETFSETGSETMYEKVWLQRHTRSAMAYYYAPPEIELVEDQRGYPGLRARNVVRDRKRRHARAAASTATTHPGLPYASP